MDKAKYLSIESKYYDLLKRHQKLISELERFLKKQSGYKELRALLSELKKTDPRPDA